MENTPNKTPTETIKVEKTTLKVWEVKKWQSTKVEWLNNLIWEAVNDNELTIIELAKLLKELTLLSWDFMKSWKKRK